MTQPSPVPAGTERAEFKVGDRVRSIEGEVISVEYADTYQVRFPGSRFASHFLSGDILAAAVVSSSPATPEGGRGGLRFEPDLSDNCNCDRGCCEVCCAECPPGCHTNAPPASPAETREGWEALWAEMRDVIEAIAYDNISKGDAADACVAIAESAVAAALAASPAVSPHAGSKLDNPPSVLDQFQRMLDQMAFKHPTGEWFVSRTVVQGEIDRARQQGPEDDWPDAASPAVSLPGEQPGGEET